MAAKQPDPETAEDIAKAEFLTITGRTCMVRPVVRIAIVLTEWCPIR